MKRLLKVVLPIIGRASAFNYISLGIITGLFSFFFITTVTKVIDIMIAGRFTVISKEYITIFILIILAYVWSRRSLALTSIKLSLKISWTLRKQIITLVLNASYRQLSNRIPQIQTAILADVSALTNASLSIIDFSIAVIISISCFIYLVSISLILFLITLSVAVVGVAVYYFTSRKNILVLEKTRKLENVFQENLNSVLNGFKEIYMEPKKGKFIYNHRICTNADDSYKYNLIATMGLINNQITGQVLFYILISSVLLVFSIVLNVSAGNIVSYVFTLLYLLGSIETIMVQLPSLMRARVAADQLLNLKKELEGAALKAFVSKKYVFKSEFQQLVVKDLEFIYSEDDSSFGIGPLDFEIKKGQTIFIYGGNGSGKTTFIYSILGLWLPVAGKISVNGILITEDNFQEFKSFYSVVFSDFYLFDEILDEQQIDVEKWNFYLKLFELEGKVSIHDNRFSTTDLSTGQRKRLRLVAALLEKKSLLILDEWAADQDPNFRKKFYTEILPLLNKEGIAIIAITHDDKYYYCADKLFKMSEGKLFDESTSFHRSGAGQTHLNS